MCLAGYAIAGSSDEGSRAAADSTATGLSVADVYFATCGKPQASAYDKYCSEEDSSEGEVVVFPSEGHRDDWIRRHSGCGGPTPVVGPDWAATTYDTERLIALVNLGGRRLC